jgi:hypothetical protein
VVLSEARSLDFSLFCSGNWLFFQIFLLVVLESLDALRTGFWLAGSVAKCSDLVLVSIRCMSLVWGSQVRPYPNPTTLPTRAVC